MLAQVAKIDPEKLAPHADEFIDALNRPEAQTRWESLDVLTELVPIDSRACDKALAGAEAALFDEDNGFVRCSSFPVRIGINNRKSLNEGLAAS